MPSSTASSEDAPITSTAWMNWKDVFLKCVQPMLAVVLLLRFSSIVDEAGFTTTIILVFFTFLVSLVTGWSACTVVSRKSSEVGFVKTMLAYSSTEFAISFSIIYLFCLLVATSTFLTSAAEAVLHIFSTFSLELLDGATHDLRLVSSVLSLITLALCMVRNRNARFVRTFIFALTCIAIALQLSSVMFRYGEYQLRRVSDRNAMIPSPPNEEISTIFAQLFPAAMCGLTILNIGSKLQNTAPRGALIAIAVSACFYGAAAMLDYVEFFARTSTSNSTGSAEYNEFLSYIYTTVPMAIVITLACVLSAVSTLKYAAVILQSLGRSNQCRCILWLAKGFGERDIPIRCLLLLSTVQILVSAIGSYDILCIPTTVFYLFAYALFNFYVFLVKLSDPEIPSPPTLLSLAISAACFIASLYTNRHLALFIASIFAISYCSLLYIIRRERNEDGEECPKSMYSSVLEQMHELQQEPDSRRHFHPQILLLSGSPAARPGLVDFAHSITRGKSLLICGYIIPQSPCSRSYLLQLKIDKQINDWLRAREVNAFGAAICCTKQAEGANILLQTAGLGRLRPNILMLGYKTGWEKLSKESISEYYGMLSNAFDKQVGVIIFRNEASGFDVTSSIRKNGAPINDDEDLAEYVDSATPKLADQGSQKKDVPRGKLLNTFRKMSMAVNKDLESGGRRSTSSSTRFQVIDKHSISEPDQKIIMAQMFRFRKRIPNARIDVFWLREAGGLTMLAPYLLTQAGSFLEGAHIRVFTKTDGKDNKRINEEQKNMAAILRKFHIDSSDLHILPEFSKPPCKQTYDEFRAKIDKYKVETSSSGEPVDGSFDNNQIFNLREKTRSFLRASELIREHSSDADLIVCTLPSARPEIPSPIYLGWIDMLSRQTPPTCLVRGNQVSMSALRLKFP
ncbi:Solute carrier family 12 protein B0303.11 [Caenorhabditis elegans]|uniref:Isoform a of Solute carrier family 12 protein B0303.11 n=1 Tax=Caenorhabditis elegans TaxID=6239 RepID=P34261-2|nr:Solute carrier family 12 protein B0303.11 [Caenorhabditis elegans]CTQ86554.1 Solute carrier family 12 protein B0303.11 [Caenorhabditis elegans]|eukprot:NP_001299854.1 Uncharacterized amino-acid permease B0303.11 [Caenorhabditis elegans]